MRAGDAERQAGLSTARPAQRRHAPAVRAYRVRQQSLRLLRSRYLRIPLEEPERLVLIQRATAANLSAEDYAHGLIRTALRDHGGPVRVKSETPAEATTPTEAAKH
ncbi:hypothetical protein GCM10017744_102150 [Streptomyces antimycoticus]|uniref:Uncharacterized protein n=1 Tax=Streptomyces antimycoticus TaxID=68175 RepID=A0A4D4KS23_9ACTN|nr:hypothetical protein SANT12839_101300 [Streptomyces antimycoticus]